MAGFGSTWSTGRHDPVAVAVASQRLRSATRDVAVEEASWATPLWDLWEDWAFRTPSRYFRACEPPFGKNIILPHNGEKEKSRVLAYTAHSSAAPISHPACSHAWVP